MSDSTAQALDTFPQWLTSLGADALELARVLDDAATPEPIRQLMAGALNYLFKSLDLIPDGIEDLGYLDDAFIVRIAAALASAENVAWSQSEAGAMVRRLAADASLLRDCLGAVYPRLERYTRDLVRGGARGRSTDEIVRRAEICTAFVNEVRAWADAYEAPPFTKDERTLVKLASFLDTKLPS